MLSIQHDFSRNVLMAQIAQRHRYFEDMYDFLKHILLSKKVFLSIETRRLVEKAF